MGTIFFKVVGVTLKTGQCPRSGIRLLNCVAPQIPAKGKHMPQLRQRLRKSGQTSALARTWSGPYQHHRQKRFPLGQQGPGQAINRTTLSALTKWSNRICTDGIVS